MSATIYFSGSITGGREDVALYRRMVEALEEDGHRVLAGAVAAEHVGDGGEALALGEIFARDLRWIDECDVVVAEVSTPSHGVGYEIASARGARGIPVIALYRRGRTQLCSAMISGDPGGHFLEYEEVDAVRDSLRGAVRDPDRLP
ncbi:MAG: nucleoside 2-deoxyribosyltransferase [Thermoanaerobaculia bacterium]